MTPSKIIWTKIDEAPALATYSLLPIIQAYTKGTDLKVEIDEKYSLKLVLFIFGLHW